MDRRPALVPLLLTLAGCTGAATRPTDLGLAADPGDDVADVLADPAGPADVLPDLGPPPEPVACKASPKAATAWYDGAVGYEVFVRSFQDSDGDGIGDLKGLISRLDALNDGDPATDGDLGVTLLWLMPIMPSPSYHGYDVTDDRDVNPDYGTLADLDTLVSEAHARGIRVVLDLVLNHTSSKHPRFLDARTGPSATHRAWYVWSDTEPKWGTPWDGSGQTWYPVQAGSATSWYYGAFSPAMPDRNLETPAAREDAIDAGRFWLARGIDGFRLDAVRYLVETGPGKGQSDTAGTHAFWREFRVALEAAKADALLVGEAWASTPLAASYLGKKDAPELQMTFDFDGAEATQVAVRGALAAKVQSAVCGRIQGYPAWGAAGSFLANHDQRRLGSSLESAGPAGLRLAAALLLLGPGTPWLYYGEEIGMRNGDAPGDEAKRLPMQWAGGPGVGFTTGTPWAAPVSDAAADSVAGQTGDPGSLLSLYRRLIRLRQAHPALSTGGTVVVRGQGTAGDPAIWVRTRDAETIVLAFNVASEPGDVYVPAAPLPAATRFADLLGGPDVERASASDPLRLAGMEAYGFRVLVPR